MNKTVEENYLIQIVTQLSTLNERVNNMIDEQRTTNEKLTKAEERIAELEKFKYTYNGRVSGIIFLGTVVGGIATLLVEFFQNKG